jgi:anti-sigma factor RsiW
MTDCREFAPMLHGLLDGELDAANALKCEEHLATCPECAARYAELKALSASIRQANLRYRAPERLKLRVRTMLARAADATRISMRRLAWPATAAAAALAASLLLFIAIPRGSDLGEEAAESHVRSLMADHLTDVASTDHHTVKPWFAGRLTFSPPVYVLAEQGFPLAGARIDYLNGRPVAAVVYRRRSHIINLFIWPAGAGDDAPTLPMIREGYNVRHWTKHGMTCWAVSDLSPRELEEFERLIQSAAPA